MTPTLRPLILVAIVCASLLPVDTAAQRPSGTERRPDDKTLSPYFVVEGGDPDFDRLPLKDTRVDVAITGVIADVTVRQVYENRGQRPLHARYVFPASTRAAVSGMTMTISDVRIVAKIKEREQAKTEFEAAKKDGKSASLLEQSRPNVFTMNVANVMPGDTILVELRYTELLVPTDGAYEFVYPTVVGPRYSEKPESTAKPEDLFVNTSYTRQGAPPKSEFHLAGVISTGVPFQELTSTTHQITVRTSGPGRAELQLADAEHLGGNRDFILRYRLAGQKIGAGLLLYQGRDPSTALGASENFFLLMAEPPQAVVRDEIPPRDYVFVVDVSGSMYGFPLDTAKKLLGDLVNVLRPTDTFNIVVFESGFEVFSPASVPATTPNLRRALQFIGSKQGGGGTRLLNGLQRAVQLPREAGLSRSVVLLTDGYIDAEADVFDYIREHLDEVNFFAFGIGSSVNRYLIEGVARAGLGEPFIVTEPDDAPEAAEQLRRYIETPVLTDIDVRFAGFDVYDVEPGKIPDLFASRPIVVFGKWRGPIGGSIEISGHTGRGAYQTSIPVVPSNADQSHAALRHLWARTRIANLSDFGPATPSQDRIGEITALGLTYSLLTKYTSFIAVHEAVRRTSGDADDVNQPLPLPDGVSDHAIGMTSGAEPDLIWVIAIAVALFGCMGLLRTRAGSGIKA
ncbi:MAG TPA: VIT domain-containing protein [Vicinamibacterales bacterium]|nr:VIT domain-containing protein [Vicinamibacterales bacterium]